MNIMVDGLNIGKILDVVLAFIGELLAKFGIAL